MRLRGDVGIALDGEEVGGAEFLDGGLGGRIEEKKLTLAFIMGDVVGVE